jgi:hypothetical protein
VSRSRSRAPGGPQPCLSEQAGEGRELSGAGDHRQASDGFGNGADRVDQAAHPAAPAQQTCGSMSWCRRWGVGDQQIAGFERAVPKAQSLSRGTEGSNPAPSSVESSANLIPRDLADQSRLSRRRPSGSGTYLRRFARQLGVSQPGGHHGCLRDGLEPVRHQVVCRNRLSDQMLVANHRSGQLQAAVYSPGGADFKLGLARPDGAI